MSKRGGFTLVEMMVVVSVLVLLVAMLVPSVSQAVSVARATACRSNLGQIRSGFGIQIGGSGESGSLAGIRFPAAETFPTIPNNVLASPETFVCPEADVHGNPGQYAYETDAGALEGLVYICRNRGFEVAFNDPAHAGLGQPGNMNLGWRTGQDAQGEYIEIGTDDNEIVTASYMDNDGHDGILRIYKNINGKRVIKLVKYDCGEGNCITYQGKPVFVSPNDPAGVTTSGSDIYGWMGPGASKNGMMVPLKGITNWCTYGMARGSELYRLPSRKILVMDYDKSIIEPWASDTAELLEKAARHLGRVNVLMADHSVRWFGPTEIDPLIPRNIELWQP